MRETAPSFLIISRPRKINQNAPHHPRTNGVEMRSVLPFDGIGVYQAEIGLVNQASGLERMARLLAGHVSSGQPVQLVVNEGHQPRKRSFVSGLPRQQQSGHVMLSNRLLLIL